jgi:hypothetical protein
MNRGSANAIFSVFLLNSKLGQVVSSVGEMYLDLIPLPLVRAFLGVSAGCILYYICNLLKNFSWNISTGKRKILFHTGELAFTALCLAKSISQI